MSIGKANGMDEVLVIARAYGDVSELRALDVEGTDGAVVG